MLQLTFMIQILIKLQERNRDTAVAVEALRQSKIEYNYEQLPFVVLHRRIALSIAIKVHYEFAQVNRVSIITAFALTCSCSDCAQTDPRRLSGSR